MMQLNENSLSMLASKAFSALAGWRERIAVRAELDSMSDLELKDVGITRNDIDTVASGQYLDTRGGFRHVSLDFARPGWKCGTHGMAR
jgi:uncharacterized protein YjiS (DUF1127 family)